MCRRMGCLGTPSDPTGCSQGPHTLAPAFKHDAEIIQEVLADDNVQRIMGFASSTLTYPLC